MEFLQSQDGQPFIRAVAQYIRQHEKALANSLQLHVQRRNSTSSVNTVPPPVSQGTLSQSSASTLAAALSFAGLSFRSHTVKSAQLTLTPHHLFYLLSRIEELDVDIGPMSIRMESIHADSSPANYVSFLQTHKTIKGRSDADSIHSVSSIRSVMSGVSALWSAMGVGSSSAKTEKARLALENDMKYIYGAFTKLPCLRLTPDHRTPLIQGFEQFPFETAVPLFAFKNLQQLEIVDLDFRTFYGWDRLAEQLCLLTIKRGHVDDPIDLLEHIVLDDAERRRRRSDKTYGNAPSTPSWSIPSTPRGDYARSHSDGGSPHNLSPGASPTLKAAAEDMRPITAPVRTKSRSQLAHEGGSPKRPMPKRPVTSYRHSRTYSSKAKRSGSGSSNNSDLASKDELVVGTNSNVLPSSKWARLVYLSLADNTLVSLPERSLLPIVPTLRSFNLSSNLFVEIPESLSRLSRLQSLDLSNCLIESVQSLAKHPLPAITTLKLRSNRLVTLAGIEKLHSLENLNVADNQINDPDEAARLTRMPNFRKLWIKHNPLTKSFPNYRTRIFNHFRRTPGFLEDIIIDDQLASYTERKQLVERAIEHEVSTITSAEPVVSAAVIVQNSLDEQLAKPALEASQRPALRTDLQRQLSVVSTKSRKGPRRRIIELTSEQAVTGAAGGNSPKTPDITALVATVDSDIPQSTIGQGEAFTPRFIPPVGPAGTDEIVKTTMDGPAVVAGDYQRGLDSIRTKLEDDWLAAIGDNTQWRSDTDIATLRNHRPPNAPQLHHYQSVPSGVDITTVQ